MIKRLFIFLLLLVTLTMPVAATQPDFYCGLYRDSANQKAYIRLKGNEQRNVYVARYDKSGAYPKLLEVFYVSMTAAPGETNLWQTPQYKIYKQDNHEIRFMIWDETQPMMPLMPTIIGNWDTEDNASTPEEVG